jgi:hypothetical protein
MSPGSLNVPSFMQIFLPATLLCGFLTSNTTSSSLKPTDSSENAVFMVKSEEHWENDRYKEQEKKGFEFIPFDSTIPSSWEDLDDFKVASESPIPECKLKMNFHFLNYDKESATGCLFKDTGIPEVLAEVRILILLLSTLIRP